MTVEGLELACPHCGWPTTQRRDNGEGTRWLCRNPGCRQINLLPIYSGGQR